MAGINDRDRLGSAGGAPTRYTINRSRSSSRTNPTQIDILEIDDSKARKTLQDFFTESRRETKSAADDIRKMWTMSIEYSDDYRKQAIANINKLEDEREAAHKAEVRRINVEYRNKSDRDKALAQEMKQYNLDRIKYIKEINAADRQGMEVMRKTEELRKKYSGTRLGRKIQDDLDRSLDLKVKLQAEYDRANSGKLSQDELIEVAENTDRLEEQLDIINGRIGDTINKSEKRTEGLKSAIKQFVIDVVSIFGKDYWEGIQKNFNSFENIYTDISGRMQTSYSDTKNILSVAASEITGSLNSAINIADDLYPALQNAVHQGFTGNGAISKAIADAEAKIIMPWLDTATDAWVNMSFNMTDDNMKLLKSQQLLLQTSKSGNRLLQSGVINSLTSEMEPLLRDIDFNTGGAANMSAEAQAIMAGWVSQGMTPQEAFEQMQKMISVQKDQYGALTSGDVTKVLMGSVADQGYKAMAESVMPLYEMAAGSDNLGASALNDILGLNLSAGTAKVAEEWVGGVKDSADYMYDASVEIWDTLVENIDEYITPTAKQRNEANNLTARNSQWLNDIPHGMEVLESVKNLVVTAGELYIGKKALDYVGSKLLGDAAGKAAGKAASGAATKAGAKGFLSKEVTGTSTATKVASGALLTAYLTLKPNTNTVNDEGSKQWIDNRDAEFQESLVGLNNQEREEAISQREDILRREAKHAADTRYNSEKDPRIFEQAVSFIYPELDYGLIGRALGEEYDMEDWWTPEKVDFAQVMYDAWREGDTDTYQRMRSELKEEMPEYEWMFFEALMDRLTSDTERSLNDLPLDWWTPEIRERYRKFDHKRDVDFYREKTGNSSPVPNENWVFDEEITAAQAMDWVNAASGNEDYDYSGSPSDGTPIYLQTPSDDWGFDEWAEYYEQGGWAIGTPYIRKKQLAFVHPGERILTARENSAFGEIGSTGLLLAGSTLINKLLGFSSFDDSDDDISREDMTDTLVESLDKVTAAIARLVPGNGIDYGNRTLPRITNNYNNNLVNLVPSISTSK